MSSLRNYLKQEGIAATVKRAWNKIFRNGDSRTVFLQVLVSDKLPELSTSGIEILDNHNRNDFELIKFWDFIKADDYIENDCQSVVMLKVDSKYVAYAAEQHETERIIHGLGTFVLNPGEGWIGPVYVSRKCRGKGYNRVLLLSQMNRLNQMGVKTIYTAINSQNTASLKSFMSMGFEEIGMVDAQGTIVKDTIGIISTSFTRSNAYVKTGLEENS